MNPWRWLVGMATFNVLIVLVFTALRSNPRTMAVDYVMSCLSAAIVAVNIGRKAR